MNRHLSRIALSGLLLAGVSFPVLAQSQQIGVTAAVNPAAEGRPPSAPVRELRVGVNVVANERIVTTAGGQAQMLFLDESAFSIGPDSDVVLDEFVYDANAGTSKIALSATKGVFRVVGGKISKNTLVELKTPTATIGIRGGIALVNVAPNGATQATFLFGAQMTVTTPGGTQTVQRPGYTVSANTPGGPPSAPVQATTQQLTGSVAALEGQAPPPVGPAAPGGGQPPGDNQVQQTQLSALGSSNAPAQMAPPGPGAPPPPNPAAQPAQATSTTNQAQQNQTQDSSNLGSGLTLSSTFNGNIVNAVNPTGTVTGGIKFGFGQNGDITDNVHVLPFQGTVTNGKFTASYTETTGSFSFPLKTGNAFSATITGNPFGSTTLSGTGFLAPDKDFFVYDLVAGSGSSKQVIFAGIPTPDSAFPTSGASFYRFLRDPIQNSNVPFIPGADGGALFSGQVPGLADLTSTLFAQSESADAAIYWDKSGSSSAQRVFFGLIGGVEGSGSSQSSATSLFIGRIEEDVAREHIVNAFFRGSVKRATDSQFRSFSGNAESVQARESAANVESDFFGSDKPKYSALAGADNSDVTQNSKQMVTQFYQGSSQAYVPANFLIPGNETLGSRTNHLTSGSGFNHVLQGYATAPGQFVNTSGSETNSSFVSAPMGSTADPVNVTVRTSAATNKVKANFFVQDGGSNTISATFGDNDTVFGDTTSTAGRSAFVDNGIYGAVEHASSPALFNSSNMGTSQLFMFVVDSGSNLSSATYCSCQFTQWGVWGGQLQLGSTGFERLHAGLWVAGVPSLASEISGLTGTATYNGHVIASVRNGSSGYAAAGQIAVGVNFGAPSSSTVSITSFDGGGFSGTGLTFQTASSGKNTFTASGLSGTGGQSGRNAQIVGSFMKNSSGDNAAEMGGQFSAAGTGYSTAGIFAAKK